MMSVLLYELILTKFDFSRYQKMYWNKNLKKIAEKSCGEKTVRRK